MNSLVSYNTVSAKMAHHCAFQQSSVAGRVVLRPAAGRSSRVVRVMAAHESRNHAAMAAAAAAALLLVSLSYDAGSRPATYVCVYMSYYLL
jgi:hypothetical protein